MALLMMSDFIAYEFGGDVRGYVDIEVELLVLCPDPEHADDIREHVAGVIGFDQELHGA